MDETIYVILKLLFDFALEVWFSICTQNLFAPQTSHRKSLLQLSSPTHFAKIEDKK